MALMDFTLSNARRFYSSMGNPLGVKGLTTWKAKNYVPVNIIDASRVKKSVSFMFVI